MRVGAPGADAGRAVAAAFNAGLHAVAGRRSDHVDGTAEGLCAEYACCGAAQYLYAFDVVQVDRQVNRKVAGLWVSERDSVEQDSNLVKGSAVHADVRLNAKSAALPDVDARGEFQQVIDRGDGRRGDVLPRQRRHHARRLFGGQRRSCPAHARGFEL